MNVHEFTTEVKAVVEELKKEELQHLGQEVLLILAAIYVTRKT